MGCVTFDQSTNCEVKRSQVKTTRLIIAMPSLAIGQNCVLFVVSLFIHLFIIIFTQGYSQRRWRFLDSHTIQSFIQFLLLSYSLIQANSFIPGSWHGHFCRERTSLIPSRPFKFHIVGYGAASKHINRLQRVQKALARTVMHQRSHGSSLSSTALLQNLHWLAIEWRMRFKLATLAYYTLASHLT